MYCAASYVEQYPLYQKETITNDLIVKSLVVFRSNVNNKVETVGAPLWLNLPSHHSCETSACASMRDTDKMETGAYLKVSQFELDVCPSAGFWWHCRQSVYVVSQP